MRILPQAKRTVTLKEILHSSGMLHPHEPKVHGPERQGCFHINFKRQDQCPVQLCQWSHHLGFNKPNWPLEAMKAGLFQVMGTA
jgi:hypothetical protein